MIEIDGSYGEGGGQILRSSVTLSALTGKPVRIENIRAKRPNPGLRAQHITAIKSVGEICKAEVRGLKISSSKIEFYPGEIEEGKYRFDVGTAGSITLVLQAILPLSMIISKDILINLRGGTDVKWSPTIDYFRQIFLFNVEKLGIDVNVNLIRRGFYPKGQGEVDVLIKPAKNLLPLAIDLQNYRNIEGIIAVSKLREDIPKRVKHSLIKTLLGKIADCKIDVDRDDKSVSEGVSVTLWSEGEKSRVGSSIVGEKSLPSEKLGKIIAEEMLREVEPGVSLDVHMSDQILIYLAYIAVTEREKSSFLVREITGHTRTNAWLIERFLPVEISMKREKNLFRVNIKET